MTIINFNKFQKLKTAVDRKTIAETNSINYGRTKADRLSDATSNKNIKKRLDQMKFEDE